MINEIKKQAILEAYNVCKGVARRACEKYVFIDEELPEQKYHLSHQTYLNYWRRAGLAIRGFGGSRIEVGLEEKIIVIPLAQIYPHAVSQRKTRGQHLSSSEKEAVISSYQLARGIAREAERHLPYSATTILSIWRKAGLIKE